MCIRAELRRAENASQLENTIRNCSCVHLTNQIVDLLLPRFIARSLQT